MGMLLEAIHPRKELQRLLVDVPSEPNLDFQWDPSVSWVE